MDPSGRKHIRYKLFPYAYDIIVHSPKGVLRANMHDIAEGGAGLFIEDVLPIGQKIELIITIKNQTFKLNGLVCWLQYMEEAFIFRAGIHFNEAEHSKALKLVENFSQS